MIDIVLFDESMIDELPRAQQPFDIIGKLIVKYDGESFSHSEMVYDEPRQKTYPDDDFDPCEYINNPEQSAYLAMVDGKCVGSIRVCKRWNGNAFIDDLAIDRDYRHMGMGTKLMDAAFEWAREKGLNAMSLETQNTNLLACRFYIKYGFTLGGMDRMCYTAPKYVGETALYFYKSL